MTALPRLHWTRRGRFWKISKTPRAISKTPSPGVPDFPFFTAVQLFQIGVGTVAYIFKEDELPSLISVVPGRERIFFVNQELAKIDDMLAGVMHYKKGAGAPRPLHQNWEQLY